MLTLSNEPETGAALQEGADIDRRTARRFKTAFRACCLIADGVAHFAMIKNMSHFGVMVQLDRPLRVGQTVSYFWDEKRIAKARVVWSKGRSHGLENEDEQVIFDKQFRYRSVRVPCRSECEVWVDGARHRPDLANLSLGGAQLVGLRVRPGALLTLRFQGVDLPNTTVRWSHSKTDEGPARSGLSFAQRLTARQLDAILSSMEGVPAPEAFSALEKAA